MSRYPAPALENLPEDLRTKILEVQEKAGFVPNVFLGLARRPAEWRAFFAYHDALMVPESVGRESNLTKGDREMIVTTTSAANNCLYCVVAHGAILRVYAKNPLIADQVAHLLVLVARLPEDQRTAVRLFFLAGRDAADPSTTDQAFQYAPGPPPKELPPLSGRLSENTRSTTAYSS